MKVTFKSCKPQGTVSAPPSKSMAHRLILCSALSDGESTVGNISLSEDIEATLRCIKALGAKYEVCGDTLKITGTDVSLSQPQTALDCGESGSTLRFFVPLSWVSGNRFEFTGAKSLMNRPQSEYEAICKKQGVRFKLGDDYILTKGKMKGGSFIVSGSVSSQFISGLLFALPLLEGDSEIMILPPVESKPYIDMTIDTLKLFGVTVERESLTEIKIKGSQRYASGDFSVEGDYSNAAFFDALNLLGGDVKVTGLDENSRQGDKVYREIFKLINDGTPEIELSDCPDLGPVSFALAAAKNGAVFTGIRRLRLKESDRISAMARELEKFGVKCDIDEDKAVVHAETLHAPTQELESHNDHRVAMALSVLLCHTGGTLNSAQAVNKSMPDFFQRLSSLGVQIQ